MKKAALEVAEQYGMTDKIFFYKGYQDIFKGALICVQNTYVPRSFCANIMILKKSQI